MPFPFVEALRLRDRPAFVVSADPIRGDVNLFGVLMVTSAANRGWADDVSLEERFAECGLSMPCVIRTARMSTIEGRRARKVGPAPPDLIAQVRAMIGRHLAL